MKLFLDTGEFDEIQRGVEWGVVDGVTTNPTLIAKAGQDHEAQVKRICGIVGNVSAEVVSEMQDDILAEGRKLASWHKNVIVKVPMTTDGLGAGRILAGEGVRINVTLCFSVNQALLAAAIGAHIVSPFVGRLDDINEDGIQVVRDIVSAYRQQGISTKVLAASLRGPLHVAQSALAGADIGTMPFSVLQAMFRHPLTDTGLQRFKKDYLKSQRDPAPQRATDRSTADVAAVSGMQQPSIERDVDLLWSEHQALASQVALLQSVADAIGDERLPAATLRAQLDRTYELLAGKVLPHIQAADEHQTKLADLDPRAAGQPDHKEAERLISILRGFHGRVVRGEIEGAGREIRRVLYELAALTERHFADDRQLKR